MVDFKKVALSVAILVLLPLFLFLFVDAVYSAPKYEDYCTWNYAVPTKAVVYPSNCSSMYDTPQVKQCYADKGEPRPSYDEMGCEVFSHCDYCNKLYTADQQKYNRNVFFIFAPLGLLAVIIGIYFRIDYLGAGLMFGGLITLFMGTVMYFSDMSKIMRALVILIELLVLIWLGYKKIDAGQSKSTKNVSAKRKR